MRFSIVFLVLVLLWCAGCQSTQQNFGDKILLYQAPTSKEIYLMKFDNLEVNTTKAGAIEGFLEIGTTSKKIK